MNWLRRRRPPRYSDFQLPDPPPYLREKVWWIGQGDHSQEPFEYELGSGRIWTAGWVYPANTITRLPAGIEFYVNGRLIFPRGDRLIPENAPELSGAVGCIVSRTQSEDIFETSVPQYVLEKIRAIYSLKTKKMDGTEYALAFQTMIGSERSHYLIIERGDAEYKQLTRQHYKVMTSRGSMLLQDVLAESQNAIQAVFALHFEHPVMQHIRDQQLLVDFRNWGDLVVLTELIAEMGGEVQWVDITASLKKTLGVERKLNREETEIKRWFKKGFNKSPNHREIKVDIWPNDALDGRPAVLVPSGSPRNMQTAKLNTAWLRTSTLIINPTSDLADHLRPLILDEKTEAVNHVPIAVHNVATNFALGAFTREYEFNQWSHVTNLVSHFKETEEQIDQLERLKHTSEELGQKQRELDEVKRELEIRIRIGGDDTITKRKN